MEGKVTVTFYCYLDKEGMQNQVLKPSEDESEEVRHEETEAKEKMAQPLALASTEDGIHTGRELKGKLTIAKSAVHDLLDAEGRGHRALFIVELD